MARILILISFINFHCSPKATSVPFSFQHETECLGIGPDETLTIMCWGNGFDKKSAQDNAVINGINDVLFKGLKNGKMDCFRNPMFTSSVFKKENEKYFDELFSNRNNFYNYVAITEKSKLILVNNNQKSMKLILNIKMSDLKNRINQDLKLNQ